VLSKKYKFRISFFLKDNDSFGKIPPPYEKLGNNILKRKFSKFHFHHPHEMIRGRGVRDKGSISPNIVRQAKSCQHKLFSKKFAV